MWILQALVVMLLLILVATPGSAADSLGRLFMTPEQRAALDSARESGNDLGSDAVQPGKRPTVSPDEPIVLNGVVRRSRGPNVAWVNGARVGSVGAGTAGEQGVHLRRGPDRHNRVTLEEAGGTTARLKPGQFWIPATGQVADCYGCDGGSKSVDPLEAPPATAPETAAVTPLPAPTVNPP